MEVSNAVGFSLPVKLIAVHTIVDNDVLWFKQHQNPFAPSQHD
jgi:hypothetical protein